MFNRSVLLLAALILSPQVLADDSDQLCTAGGYYSGAQDQFMSDVATYVLSKRKVLGNTKCTALWQAAFPVGERITRTGNFKPEDRSIINDAQAFGLRVVSSIAKGAGY